MLAASLNPADDYLTQLGVVSRLIAPLPATPGQDFCGRVVATGAAVDSFAIGDLVFGKLMPQQHGALGEFVCTKAEGIARVWVPGDGVFVTAEMEEAAAAVGTAGLTAYQAIVPFVQEGKRGQRVFVHGGAGGVGTFAVQIAKVMGCHVTVSAVAEKHDKCREIGADECVDYKSVNVIEYLKGVGQVFDLVVDNVGEPAEMYREADAFLKDDGRFVQVGARPSVASAWSLASRLLTPGFLGGGRRRYSLISTKLSQDELVRIGEWMKEGKVKAVVDSVFEYEDVPKAFERLKSGDVVGKVVVRVSRSDATDGNGES